MAHHAPPHHQPPVHHEVPIHAPPPAHGYQPLAGHAVPPHIGGGLNCPLCKGQMVMGKKCTGITWLVGCCFTIGLCYDFAWGKQLTCITCGHRVEV